MGAEEENREANQRSRLNPSPNPITEAQFLSWKRQKDEDASARRAEAARKRAEDIAAGALQMNGRELFLNEPWVFDNSRY
ncbi:uncharacterized protein LOC127808484 [Diospyros lotus]|uniref:uncharacterized protein LOC127808484 n=1 Tax=Diospyros lotus TaxID=55363 RepID=UPI00224FF6A6|nr:uncharacterized protein LOC127808484 [Diospyros lotus]XP_052203007.1 uncharacterized protein LOC127808484 [Diospyros lotus]